MTGEAAIAAAEVVERDLKAGLLQAQDAGLGQIGINHRCALGEFDDDASWINSQFAYPINELNERR